MQSKGLSKATVQCYHTEILEFIVWCDVQNLEPEAASSNDITAYLHHLQQKGQSNSTRNINLNIVKHYYNYLTSTEAREDNPARQIKLRGTRRKRLYPLFSKQELEQLYHSYYIPEQSKQNNQKLFALSQISRRRNKAILSLMVYQGLATDEINRLQIGDVRIARASYG